MGWSERESRSSIFFVFFLHNRLGIREVLLGASRGLLILRLSPAILPFLEKDPRIWLPGARAALMICRSIANAICTYACTCKSVLRVFFLMRMMIFGNLLQCQLSEMSLFGVTTKGQRFVFPQVHLTWRCALWVGTVLHDCR